MKLSEEEYLLLVKTVEKLNEDSGSIAFRLVDIKGTYYIYPEFSPLQ